MKKAGKIKFFGFSTHTNMEDCLLGAAKLNWIDAIMFSYNFRLMNTPKMKEALAACVDAGIGLVAMKTQASGPAKAESETELQAVGRFLERGFTDKQAKLKVVWDNPNIASICSQMPSLTILQRPRAARPIRDGDLLGLLRRLRPHLPGGRGRGGAGERCDALLDVLPGLRRPRSGPRGLRRALQGGEDAVDQNRLCQGRKGLSPEIGYR